MWINTGILKLAEDILTMSQALLDRLKALRPLTDERNDLSKSHDVTILQMEVRLLRKQRAEVGREIVAQHLEMMSLRAEVMKLRGDVFAAQNVGSLPKRDTYLDSRSAAANDDTFTFDPTAE